MIQECSDCKSVILTESDLFFYENRPGGEYYNCGCEIDKIYERVKNWKKAYGNVPKMPFEIRSR